MKKIFSLIFLILFPIILQDSHIEDPFNRSWSRIFLDFYRTGADLPKKKLAVACPEDPSMLETVSLAHRLDVAEVIMIGDEKEIKYLAKHYKINIEGIKIINQSDKKLAAYEATKLVHDGECDILMRGVVPISDFMSAVKDEKIGLNSGRLISYIIMTEIEGIDQLLFLTDGEIVTYPSLEDKVHLIENALELAKIFKIKNPKVAALAPIEYVDPTIQSTVDADALKKMNDEGKIKDCIIEGPISMDMAISLQACYDKSAWTSRVKGDANILLFPDFMASNMSWRLVKYIKRHLAAMLLFGTTKPVVMTGRGDDVWTKLNSIVMAKYVDDYYHGGITRK